MLPGRWRRAASGHVTHQLSRGRCSPDQAGHVARPAGTEETGGPWQDPDSGFRCCWRQRSLGGPRPCGLGPNTSRPPTGTTPSSRRAFNSSTTLVRPRSRAAPSWTRLSCATVTCSSALSLGSILPPQVSRTCPAWFRALRQPALGQLPRLLETPLVWYLPSPLITTL